MEEADEMAQAYDEQVYAGEQLTKEIEYHKKISLTAQDQLESLKN